MAHYEHLPIFKAMLSLAVEVEKAVRYFPRYHKYTLGSELRGFCHEALGLIAEASAGAAMEIIARRGGLLQADYPGG